MKRRASFEFGNELVKSGTQVHIDLPVARLPTGTWVSLPVDVFHGKHDGPVVWLSAAIHGDELNGVDIIWQLMRALKVGSLRGTLLCVPVVNVFGFIQQTRHLPDRRDLNRSFPGSARGSMASQLAHLFLEQVVRRCSFGIDLHTGSNHRDNLPQIRADLNDPILRAHAETFGAPVVLPSVPPKGSLRAAAAKIGVRTLLYEAGEAQRFDPVTIGIGTRGVVRVLHALDMLETIPELLFQERATGTGSRPPLPPPHSLVAESSHWLRASRSGLFDSHVDLGDTVRGGEPVGTVHDAFKNRVLPIRARKDGMVIGLGRNPLVNRGEAVMHIACFDDAAPLQTIERS